jgi:hypothetical protein
MQLTLLGIILTLAAPGWTEEPDWLGIRADLERLSLTLPSAEPVAGPSQPALTTDLELRDFCGMSDTAFLARLVAQDCEEGDCAGRPQMVKQSIDAWTAELDGSLAEARTTGELPFLPTTSNFPQRPPDSGEEIAYRAAADLWLRNRTDAAVSSLNESDRFFVGMKAWCRLIERNTAAAVSFVTQNGFPTDDSSQGRRQVAAIIYIGQHSAMDYGALSTLRLEAEKTFRRAQLSPFYMAQILDVEREAYDGRQVIGHLTTCEGARAVFDPQLVDVRLADEWRAANGLATTDAYLQSASRRCR